MPTHLRVECQLAGARIYLSLGSQAVAAAIVRTTVEAMLRETAIVYHHPTHAFMLLQVRGVCSRQQRRRLVKLWRWCSAALHGKQVYHPRIRYSIRVARDFRRLLDAVEVAR